MTPAAFLTAFAEAVANDGALVLLVLLVLWMGARKKWVWGYQVDAKDTQLTDERVKHMGELGELRGDHLKQMNEMREERDTWRRMALLQQNRGSPQGDD
jgi:hypothetical protein